MLIAAACECGATNLRGGGEVIATDVAAACPLPTKKETVRAGVRVGTYDAWGCVLG